MRLRFLMVALLGAGLVALTRADPAAPAPAALPVRWSEGTVHGFLELRKPSGELLAHGDLLQAPRDSTIESRLVFEFSDGSLFRETVNFTQHGVFRMEHYRLQQHGKAFSADLDVTLSRSGEYVVTSTSRDDGKEEVYRGTLDLPADVYNGMVPIIGKNVSLEKSQEIHVVAFTPKPVLIGLEFKPAGIDSIAWGRHREAALRFRLNPRLNLLQRVGAALTKKTPPASHLWIVTEGVPAFVRFEGPMYSGPVWRVDLTGPRWPDDSTR